VYRNTLTGTIPKELGKLTRVRQLFLHMNKISGVIPQEIGDMASLESLYATSALTRSLARDRRVRPCTMRWLTQLTHRDAQ
jgi:hypothetical protein